MEITDELRSAIENLYVAFSEYPLRDHTDACACCHTLTDEKRLHRKSLREMNAKDLWQYATDALFVWGDVTDFKHFLPRIFELAVVEGDEFVDPQVVFNKLYHGEWWSWPEAEQRTIKHFFNALWKSVVNSQPHQMYGEEIENWLCGMAQAVAQMSTYLNTWLAIGTENARLNLAGFIADTDFVNPKHGASGYWEGRRELFEEVADWVRSDAVKKNMAAIASEYPHYDFVERAYVSLP